MPRVRAVLLAGLTVLTACGAPQRVAAAPDTVDWRDCGDGMRCASLTVPIDWSTPDGPKTTVDIATLPATNQETSRGSLVVNIGGPSSTIRTIRAQPAAVARLRAWFDVVLIDPRGYGDRDSPAMRPCGVVAPPQFALTQLDGRSDWRAYATRNAAYDRSCRQRAGAHYHGYTGWQVAHDLERLRGALGEPRLNYLGNSYGAVYGQAYAELFGGRVGRMYLDGVPDHTRPSLTRWLLDAARTDEQQLHAFARWCARREGCPLGGNAIAVYDTLRARPGMDRDLLVAAVREGLNPPYWPNLARALDEARRGDPGRLRTDPVLHPRQDPPGTPSYPGRAALCHDFMPEPPDYATFRGMEAVLRSAAPRVGWMQGRYQVARCLGIARGPAYPPHPLRAPDVPAVLVGIGDLDNNTNRLGARHVAAQLPGSVTVRHGDGHGAYLLQGGRLEDSCLRETVRRYLVHGTLPERGKQCPAVLLPAIPARPAG